LGGEKWYIGGRTPGGEERFYRLAMARRERSGDRLSLDRLSLWRGRDGVGSGHRCEAGGDARWVSIRVNPRSRWRPSYQACTLSRWKQVPSASTFVADRPNPDLLKHLPFSSIIPHLFKHSSPLQSSLN
jgi:hypothetical protein